MSGWSKRALGQHQAETDLAKGKSVTAIARGGPKDGEVWGIRPATNFRFDHLPNGLLYTFHGEIDEQGRRVYVWDGPAP